MWSVGGIEMDHARKGVDMDASCDDVCRHQRVSLPLGERVQGALPLALRTVAVHRDGPHPLGLELPDDAVGPALGPAEDERLPVVLYQFGRDGNALGPVDLPEVVDYVALRLLRGLNGDPDRIMLVVANDRLDFPTDRGRKEENLALRCGLVEQASDSREEAHVRHPVCLVEHHGRDIVEADIAALDQVLEAPRTGHDDVDALVQGTHLVAIAGTPEDGDDPLAVMPEQVSDDVMHLGGQLPCGNEDQCPGAARTRLD